MRILVVQLLRMGDIVMSTPLLRALKDRWPESEVELLINSSFRGLKPMLGQLVNQVHQFDYGLIQSGLGEVDRPFLESYWRVQELIEELNQREFDLILNVTHNRLSGWLVGLLKGKRKEGLSFEGTQMPTIVGLNSWFRYINENFSSSEPSLFHWIDAFLGAIRDGCIFRLGHDGSQMPHEIFRIELQETSQGIEELRQSVGEIFLNSSDQRKWIVIQPLTSDPKKSWDELKYAKTMELFFQLEPLARIVVVGAPSERERLQKFCTLLGERGISVVLLICSLEGVFSLLRRAHLLVTGDTGVKHMASATEIKIVEISVGSSQLDKTGAYSPHAMIIQSGRFCAPCTHSQVCPYEGHPCHEIDPELVALSMRHHLMGNEHGLKALAEEYRDQVRMYRTSLTTKGFWSLRLGPGSDELVRSARRENGGETSVEHE